MLNLEEIYKFRLQKLLDIRIDKEEESKRVFKEAKLEKEKTEGKLISLREDYTKFQKCPEDDTVALKKLRSLYLNCLDNTISETKVELENKNALLDEKREELKQKQIDRKTVETLKEKKKSAFIKERQMAEQKANDEFALYGFIRTRERR